MVDGSGVRPASVLIVEDDAEVRAAVAELLRQDLPNTELLSAADGDEAWELLKGGGVDVLLSDIVMPGLDGIELARRVRRHPETAATNVILLRAGAPPEALLGAKN